MPSRILKESICTSDTLDQLSWFEECFFYRLIVNCDDYGRMDARPAILKARLFPLKDITIDTVKKALNALRAAGLIDLYDVSGRSILQLRTWERHQQIRAKKSKYPAKEDGCTQPISSDINCNHVISDDSKCARNPIQSESESKCGGVIARAREDAPPAPAMPFGLSDADVSASLDRDQQIEQTARECGLPFAPANMLTARDLAAEHGLDTLIRAMRRAADGKSQTWGYVKGILRSWKQQGYVDDEQKPRRVNNGRPTIANYTQREYSDEELNRQTDDLLREAAGMGA